MRPTGIKLAGNFQRKKGRILNRMIATLDEGGAQVAWVAYQIAPMDTGHLRSTLTNTPPEPAGGGTFHYATRIGPLAFYGGFQELGTIYFDAQPYLRPAMTILRQGLIRTLKRAIVEASNS